MRPTVGPLLACWQRITSSRLKLTRLGQEAGKLGHHQQLPSDAWPAASQNMRYAQAGNCSQPCFNHRLLYYFSETKVTSETQSSSRSSSLGAESEAFRHFFCCFSNLQLRRNNTKWALLFCRVARDWYRFYYKVLNIVGICYLLFCRAPRYAETLLFALFSLLTNKDRHAS